MSISMLSSFGSMNGSLPTAPQSKQFAYGALQNASVAATKLQLIDAVKHQLGARTGYSSAAAGWLGDVLVERWTLPPSDWPESSLQKHRLAVFLGPGQAFSSAAVGGHEVTGFARAGHVRVIPQGIPARSAWSSDLNLAVIEFPSTVIDEILEEGAPAPLEQLSPETYVADRLAHELTLNIVEELINPTERVYAELLRLNLITHILERYGPRRIDRSPPSGCLSASQGRQVLDCIRGDIEGKLSVSTLAQVAGMSVAHFARAFRRTFRETPHRLILRWRLERAVRLILRGGLSLAEAASAAGFYDQAHMTNVMRRHFDMKPGDLLRQ